jgi:hypothetical protein
MAHIMRTRSWSGGDQQSQKPAGLGALGATFIYDGRHE